MGGLENIKRSNQLLNRNLIFLTELLEKHDIKFFVVKGQTVVNLYPHPLHRIGGDTDFYCFSKDLERLISILHKELNIELEKDESEQHYTFQYNETLFELHFTLYKFADIENQRYFDNLIDTEPLSYVLIDNKKIPILSPTLNLAYTFLHLYHHLIELGVALRQFCDIAILCYTAAMAEQNQNKEKSIDKEKLTNILTHLDFLSAFKTIGTILIEELGLSKNYFPYQLIKQDYERKNIFLALYIKEETLGNTVAQRKLGLE